METFDVLSNEQIAKGLMQIAARRAGETQFGWAHPDCEILEEAARILRGERPRVEPDRVYAVLS